MDMLQPQGDDTIQTSLNSAPKPNKKDLTLEFSIPNTTGRLAQRFYKAVCTLSAVCVCGHRSRHDENIVEQAIKLWLTTRLGRDFIAKYPREASAERLEYLSWPFLPMSYARQHEIQTILSLSYYRYETRYK